MANLPITADTSQLDGVTRAMNAMIKSVEGLARVTPRLETVLTQLANKAEKLQKNQKNVSTETENTTKVLKRQQDILKGMVDGYSRGEASILATGRAAGLTATELKKLEAVLVKQRELSGKNPFDDTISATRKLSREIEVLELQYDALTKGTSFAKREAEEYVRTLAKARMVAEEMAGDPAEWASEASRIKFVTKVVQEQTAEYRRLAAERDKLLKRADVFEGLTKGFRGAVAQGLTNAFKALEEQTLDNKAALDKMKNASERLDDTLARMRTQVRGMLGGLTKEASAGLFAFEQTARAAGKTEAEIQRLVAEYKGLQMQMTDISAKNRRLGSSFFGLQGIIRAAFPAAGAIGFAVVMVETTSAVIQTADALTLLSNRISVATGGTANLNTEFGELLRIANESRTSVQDVGVLYSRLIPVVEKLGGTTAEAAAITESFSKLLLLGGSNTREASAAIVQFSQALGKGKLDGDEFRSIAEATPEVLRLLEDSLGKTRGELMKMSEEGQLTADILGNVLIDALEGLDARLLGIPLTVGQSFQVLKNNLTDSVRLFENSAGAVGSLSSAIQSVATFVYDMNRAFENGEYVELIETMKDLGTWVGTLAVAFGISRLATTGAEVAIKAYNKSAGAAVIVTQLLNSALGMNPYIKAATVVLALATAIFTLRNETFELNGTLVDISSLFEAVFGTMVDTVTNFVNEYLVVPGLFQKTLDTISTVANGIQAVNNFILNAIIGTFIAAGKTVGNVAYFMYDSFKNSFSDISDLVSAFFDDILSGDFSFTKVGETISSQFTRKLDIGKQAVKDIADAYSTDYVGAIRGAIKEQYESVVATAGQIKVQKDYESILDDLVEQNERLAKEEEDRAKRKKELLDLISQAGTEESDSAKNIRDEISKLFDAEEARSKEIRRQLELGRELNDTEKARIELTAKYGAAVADRLVKQRELNDADQAALDLIFEYNRQQEEKFNSHKSNIKNLEDEISKLEDEVLLVGKSAAQIREYELDKKRASLANLVTTEDIARLEEEIKLLEKRNNLKDNIEAQEASIKAAEKTKQEFEKIQDDIAKSVGDAIIAGGQKGRDILKNMFKAQVFRIFIEPTVRNIAGSVAGALGVPGASGGFDLASLANIASTAVAGGIEGLALQKGLENLALNPQVLEKIGNAVFFNTGGALADFGRALTTNASAISSLAGEIAPFAGAITSVLQGNVAGGIGNAIGTAVGSKLGTALGSGFGPIGAAIGGFIGGKVFGGLGGSGKISNSALPQDSIQPIADAIAEQYKQITSALGATAQNIAFSVSGGTGRQGQNPFFVLNATKQNKSIFSSYQTKEGQADGLFLAGEIGLNEKNVADQSIRLLFAALKETKFAENINAVIKSTDLFSDSFEELNTALSDIQLLNVINTEFPKIGGVLATLANQSIETVKTFVLLAGGVENLQNLQSAYIQAIYTEEEKLALANKNLTDAFASLNLTVPSSTEQFKQLVESQRLSTVEGQATYLALLQLSGAFAEVTRANEEAAKSAREAAEEQARVNAQKILDERIALEEELYDLITSSTQKLADQRNALDASNRALFDQVQLVKEQQAQAERQAQILEERKTLEEQLLSLQGNTAALRQIERNALDASNRSLFDQIKALEDATELRNELTQKISEQENVISEVENRILSLQQQATQNYLDAQQKVVSAQQRVNDLTLETARNFLNLGKTLRDFVSSQRQTASTGNFQDTIRRALSGDADALGRLPDVATQALSAIEGTSRSAAEVEQRRAAILNQVSLAASIAESLGISAVEEDPLVVAQRELTAAQTELANTLAIANELNAPLVQTQQNLIVEYTKALSELAAANASLDSLLASLNLVNNGGTTSVSTMSVSTPTGQVTAPMSTVTSPTMSAPALEQQVATLTAKVEQLIVENRAGQQAIANNTGKSAKILERADDGDAINVRVLTQ